ncbi:AGE family epimerase/isomerase [Methylocella sp.]|uniref:AGE family epimerase/isomerase n=1 Tax=Methylocella sp. TaxID=1978226 RepID=UPI0037842A95
MTYAPSAEQEAGASAGAAAAAFRDWITTAALPLWGGVGFDATLGGFHERLDWDGRPLVVAPRRSMVQARQIYVFSHAARLGWAPAESGRRAEAAMASLLRLYADDGKLTRGVAFSVGPDGAVVSAVRDAYAHAFVLFALASLFRLNGDATLLGRADEAAGFIDASLEDKAFGGLFDRFPVDDLTKRQNPLMHLLEAFLALEEAAPGRGFLEPARRIVDLFRTRLFTPVPGVLLEYFAQDWSDHPDSAKAGLFEPGHHFEWVWLLSQYERLSGETLAPFILQLHQSAARRGFGDDGLIVDEIDRDMIVRKSSHRVWPHTEALKAAAAMAEKSDAGAPALAARMVGALTSVFLDRPFLGGWTDHIGEDGAPLVDYVPASSLYHLFFAAAEASRVFEPART